MKRKSKIFIVAFIAIMLVGMFALTAFIPFSGFVTRRNHSIAASLINTSIEKEISKGIGFEKVAVIPAHAKRIKIEVYGKVLYNQPNVVGLCRVPALNSDGLKPEVPTPIVDFQLYTIEKGVSKIIGPLISYEGKPISIVSMNKKIEVRARLWLYPVSLAPDGSVLKGKSEDIQEAGKKIMLYTNTTTCGAGPLKAVITFKKP